MLDREFNGGVYFRMLAAVAAADGEVADSEVDKFAHLIKLGGGDPSIARPLIDEALEERDEPLWFLPDNLAPAFVRVLLRDALALSASDGKPSGEEREIILEAAEALGAHEVVRAFKGGAADAPPSLSDRLDEARYGRSGVRGFDGEVYFRILAMVAAIDGHAQAEEIKKLREMLEYTGVKPQLAEGLYDEAIAHRQDPMWFLTPNSVSKSFATLCLRDACIMAFADHEVHETERALLHTLRDALGCPDHDLMLPDETTGHLPAASPTQAIPKEARRSRINLGLKAVSGTAVLGGGGYILLGGPAAKFAAGAAMVAGTGGIGFFAPALVLLGAGVMAATLKIMVLLDQ